MYNNHSLINNFVGTIVNLYSTYNDKLIDDTIYTTMILVYILYYCLFIHTNRITILYTFTI